MIPEEILKEIGLSQFSKTPWIWGDWEDLEFNNRTHELFHFSCVDGTTSLYRKVKDGDDLKQAIYDGFPFHRDLYNLD